MYCVSIEFINKGREKQFALRRSFSFKTFHHYTLHLARGHHGLCMASSTMSRPKHHIRACRGKTRQNPVTELTRHVCPMSQLHKRACLLYDRMTEDQTSPGPDHRKACLSIQGQQTRLTCPCSYNRIESSGLQGGPQQAVLSLCSGPMGGQLRRYALIW